jgi:type I restriction enzyme R subunit
MSNVGDIERRTQNRVVKLLHEKLRYSYLGKLEAESNRNIKPELLGEFLASAGVSAIHATRAVAELERAANDSTKYLYDRNREVYDLLRYGVKVRGDHGELTETVWLIDWEDPTKNHFAVAEEVTVEGQSGPGSTKRPDVVLYVNGIALGVLELKRSTVSVAEGIRQNLDNQRPEFIEAFFSTMQWIMAGNDTEGLRYGTIETPEKYYLAWKEHSEVANPLDRALLQICDKHRFLELIHDFVVFDAGTKKLCRPNQYFGVKAAQAKVLEREGGIIWHTQGSGKSLTMVWLAKWIREHIIDPRVILLTDRTELDDQIESVFKGVNEQIYRTSSGADLVSTLNESEKWLICSLIHKFGRRSEDEGDVTGFIEQIKAALPANFRAKGDIFVFIDECHRTQSGKLHTAMETILPEATFIGFTGTPLLKRDKASSIETFGPYIHTYKLDEAVADGVVVDLRYEARDVDQRITSQDKIDRWFAAKTAGLNDVARAELKKKWGTMQQVLSSKSRLNIIVSDVVMDMATRPRLMDDRGNAILVASSIYEACLYYELFAQTPLAGKVGIITSYRPTLGDLKGETIGEGETLPEHQYNVYKTMLAEWFRVSPDEAINLAERYEQEAKKRFVDEPGQLKLLIVVDKLLTGFDAPSATYLYIDKQMRDHGLFQAICRVNRLDGDDKIYGYVIDYKDLFKSIEGAVRDYTSEAFDAYDKVDVEGLLNDRVAQAKQDLDDALEAVRAVVEPVDAPKDTEAYLRFFCAKESGNANELKANEEKRYALYKSVGKVLRAFAAIATDAETAGYTVATFEALRSEVANYEAVRTEVKLASGDYVDLKMYEPAMRHLIDTYITAEDSQKISAFDDLSFVQLLAKKGAGAVQDLPEGLRKKESTAAEAIENNVRRLIIDESPINPRYYDKMSELLNALIEQRRQQSISYQAYLEEIANLAALVLDPSKSSDYPARIKTQGQRALFDTLGGDEEAALQVDAAVREAAQDGWRANPHKLRKVRRALKNSLSEQTPDSMIDSLLDVLSHNLEH